MSDPGSSTPHNTRDGLTVIRLGASSSPWPGGGSRIPGDRDDEDNLPSRQAWLAVALGLAFLAVGLIAAINLGRGDAATEAPDRRTALRVETPDSEPETSPGSVASARSSTASSPAPPVAVPGPTSAPLGGGEAPSGTSPAPVAPATTGAPTTAATPATTPSTTTSPSPSSTSTSSSSTSTSTTSTTSTSTTSTSTTTTTTSTTTTTAVPAAPSIASFVAASLGAAQCGPEAGTSYELRWRTGDAEYVTVSGAGGPLPRGRLPSEGERQVCVPDDQSPVWTLSATGPGGTSSATVTPY
jgi:hypothetical protein